MAQSVAPDRVLVGAAVVPHAVAMGSLLPRSCAASSLLWLATFASAQGDEAAKLEAKKAELVAEARVKLAAVGYSVPEAVGARTRTAAEVIDDLRAHQELLFPRDGFELQFALLKALRLDPGRDAAALRERTIAEMARGIAAYYDPIGKAFVLLSTQAGDVNEALGGSLALVTHELVHACQDARDGGLGTFFAAQDGSIDRVLARRIVVEGEAEVVAVWALVGEAEAKKIGSMEMAHGLDKLFAGQLTGAIYEAGRRVMALRFAAGGRDGLAKLWAAPPTSTEQLLHADKLGNDVPQQVVLPDFGALRVVASTTLGELLVQEILRQLGASTNEAYRGACGWDGDTLAIVQGEKGPAARGVVWRTYWDRDEDASQFEQRMAKARRGRTQRHGRVVDYVQVPSDELEDDLVAKLAAAVPELVQDADAAVSTAAAEDASQREAAAQGVRGGRWEIAKFGLSVPVPKGFVEKEVRGLTVLIDKAAGRGFANNINVQAAPRGPIADNAQLLQQNREQLEAMTGIVVDRIEASERSGQPVIEVELHGRLGRSSELHCLVVAFLRGDQTVSVTMTVGKDDWAASEAEARRVMQGIEISPP